MKLLTKAIKDKLPKLYETEDVAEYEKVAIVKFFCPWNQWTWYGIEYDGKDIFFGYVVGLDNEYGYFSLSELKSVRAFGGLKIERDKFFEPTKMMDIRRK